MFTGPEMSKRTHFWLRVAALVLLAAVAYMPRGVEGRASTHAAGSASGTTAEIARR